MKRIAVIGLKGLPAFGGAARVGESIIEQLKSEFEFTIYSTSSHTKLKTGEYNGIFQVVFKNMPLKKLNIFYYYVISAVHCLLFGKYEIIHIHHRDASFIIPLLNIRFKTVLTLHGFGTEDLSNKWNHYKWYFNLQENVFLRHASILTSVSKEDKLIIEKKLRVPVRYIPNGINYCDIQEIPKSLNYIMFAAGRIISFKKCDLFLGALKIINYPGRIFICGSLDESTYKNVILNLAEGLNVTFTGLIQIRNELLELYRNAKYFVFPSSREAMSMVLLEVASLSTPLICSDIPANRNIFNDDEVLFFKSNDVEDLARKISWAENNLLRMQEKAANALYKLKTKYRWEILAKDYSRIYDFVTEKI